MELAFIESLPPALLGVIGAGEPPPGVDANFINPPSLIPAILGICTSFFVLAVVCFSLRVYVKLALVKSWRWDDWTCLLGFLFSIAFFAAVVVGGINGTAGRHIWDMHLSQVFSKTSLYQDYLMTVMVTPALGLIKLSLFLQYYILFQPLRWVRISVYFGASISAAFYIAVTVTAFVLESPWPGESWIADILSWHYLAFARFSIPTGVIGMLVDLYLFVLPIPAVVNLQMSAARKAGVLVVFMTGGAAAAASVASLYYRVQLQENSDGDPTWDLGYLIICMQIEMFAGVAASSMPAVKQFFHRHFHRLSSSSSSSSATTRKSKSKPRSKSSINNNSNTPMGFLNRERDGTEGRHLKLDSHEGSSTKGFVVVVEETEILDV